MAGSSTHLRIVPETQMDPALDAEIRHGLCVCFPPDVAVFSKTRAWHDSGPSFSVVIEYGGQVIGHVGVVDRTIHVDSRPIRAAGVQNVFVLPEFRRQGYVDQLMTESMNEAGRQGYDCGLLFCLERLCKVYARTGWRMLESVETVCLGANGQEESLPAYNLAMWYPLSCRNLTAKRIHLCGRDW